MRMGKALYLSSGVVLLCPLVQDEDVVCACAHDHLRASSLELVKVSDIAGQMGLRAACR